MSLSKTEGIVLHALAFKEHDFILTVFTPKGLIKFFAKGTRRYNPLATPFTVAEFIYKTGKNELHRLEDGSLISQNLGLRKSLDNLLAAQKLSSAILKSQMPGKDAPGLYILFFSFLQLLSQGLAHAEKLLAAFYLKVMKHEGILQTSNDRFFRFAGEAFRKEEAPLHAQEMTVEEEHLLHKIAESRKLDEILSFSLPAGFEEKVEILFNQAFSACM